MDTESGGENRWLPMVALRALRTGQEGEFVESEYSGLVYRVSAEEDQRGRITLRARVARPEECVDWKTPLRDREFCVRGALLEGTFSILLLDIKRHIRDTFLCSQGLG